MEARPRETVFLDAGGVPEWLDSIEDRAARLYDAIVARLERVEEGNLGDCAPVGGGVSELRFMKTGPGYRASTSESTAILLSSLGLVPRRRKLRI